MKNIMKSNIRIILAAIALTVAFACQEKEPGDGGTTVVEPIFPEAVENFEVVPGASQGASENSGILWCWEGPLGTPLSLVQWKRASSLLSGTVFPGKLSAFVYGYDNV